MKSNNLGWLTLVSYDGVCLAEFNMNSPRVRHYVISVLLPSIIRRRLSFVAIWDNDAQFAYPYHYSFVGDIFDSIHVSRELSNMRVISNYKGLTLLDPADCMK